MEKDELAEETLALLEKEASVFYNENHKLFTGNEAQAGHDFWLTRNRHGSGYWDIDNVYGDHAQTLTDKAHKAGERTLYYGDDGKIYQARG